MGKFKIGDKVRVREDLEVGKTYGGVYFGDFMEAYKGKIGTITECSNNYYRIDKRVWQWSDEMLESVQEEFTFQEVIARIKPNETYENMYYAHKLKSISMDKNGTLRMKYIESDMNDEKTTLLGDNVYISVNSTFKLKEFKKSFTLYIVEHQKDGKQYKFRSDDNLAIGDFVICDTKYGKTYGKVVKIKLIETSHTDSEALQVFEEDYNQSYKECWMAVKGEVDK